MKKLLTITILIVSAAFSNCSKIYDTTWMYYDETKCADPWREYKASMNDKKKNAKKYLKDKDIKVFKIKILGDGTEEACKSCGCKSGNRIHVEIKEVDVNKATSEGFYK